ncbi:cytochrome b/b6 domain-containing protein [Vibrio sp. 10N]|uniref:cytochrome b/b6 domain-containing protein n=1 Tax=Vibrio sp. 10N TaxID=3058938 RepID=UPI00281462A6|nr:hypothetical protein VB10N_12850 [Vibrio sp. 10N]
MNVKSLSLVCLLVTLNIAGTNASTENALSTTSRPTGALETNLHPNVVLKDANGAAVLDAKQTISSIESCGGCHDVEYIQSHSDHQILWQSDSAFTVDDYFLYPLRASSLATSTTQPPLLHDDKLCLTCHTSQQQRVDLDLAQLSPAGEVTHSQLQISKPNNDNCAQCHGIVDNQLHQPLTLDQDLRHVQLTLTTGQILSPQKIALSGINIADKGSQTRSFDIHSERLVDCVACHYSRNNPVYTQQHSQQRLAHLTFDPRRPDIGDYLIQPSHQLANTRFSNDGSCQSCHDGTQTHDWLPAYNKHVKALVCESCHVPSLFGPTLKTIDWRILNEDGLGVPTYRNVAEDGLISGFQPQLVQLPDSGEVWRPSNRITMSYWQHGVQQQPVPAAAVIQASLAALDADSTSTSYESVEEQLRSMGYCDITMAEQTKVLPIAHGVVSGEWAIRDCQSCHSGASLLATDGGRSSYILGRDRTTWLDQLGLALFITVIAITSLHSLLRYKLSPSQSQHSSANEVYMYDRYERLWHWLQATTIFILLSSGLVIHLPDTFDWLSFSYMVQIHQILGFVLLINAALSLFYHLASGEIRQYLPRPYGLIHDMMAQGLYYAKGIFQGAPHPFHKTKNRKLNPLQQITYFAILNLLLPAQLITGFALWMGNYWPALTEWFGGSELLLPLHVGLAWMFASFIVMHVYLTTTVGSKPSDGIKAMVSGWEPTEAATVEETAMAPNGASTTPSAHKAADTAQPLQGGRS